MTSTGSLEANIEIMGLVIVGTPAAVNPIIFLVQMLEDRIDVDYLLELYPES